MRWSLPLFLFLLAWIEISLFIQVAHQIGVLLTLILVILTSMLGVSLVKNQGMKSLRQMQEKLVRNENPAQQLTRSVSLLIAGGLLLIPGFFTDFLGLLLLLPPIQRCLTAKLVPMIRIRGVTTRSERGYTMEGEYEHKTADQIEKDKK